MATAAFSGLSLHLYEHRVTASPLLTVVLPPVPDRSIRFTGDPFYLRDNASIPKLAGKTLPLTDSSKIFDITCFMRGSASCQSLSTLDISRIYVASFFSVQHTKNAENKSLCATAPHSQTCHCSDRGFYSTLPHLHS